MVSTRAEIITRRTYNHPKDEGGYETWEETVDRVIRHQKWLWERAKGSPLVEHEYDELSDLKDVLMKRQGSVSGRTLWLGGTDVAKKREASQFNCSFTRVQTVFDVVDAFWLLLQGCGVGFEPVPGVLNGFAERTKIRTVSSNRLPHEKGVESNLEFFHTEQFDGERTYFLSVGDSAEAWAKAVGKLLAMKEPVNKIVLDFQEIRGAGERLSGYGWICGGYEPLEEALLGVCEILNRRAGQLLTRIDILDIMNLIGTTLSSRRSAEIALVPFDDIEAEEFATAKKDHWLHSPHRAQSNNSLLFYHKPSKLELRGLFQQMLDCGGSEPGFINAQAARKRASWFNGVNPCAEILLGDKSFCNLIELNMAAFRYDENLTDMHHAMWLLARANYRQTCVSLKDGVLSDSWHELNQFLRLCGCGITGIVQFADVKSDVRPILEDLRKFAHSGVHSMADELGLPYAKAVTTVKPSGTLSKIMDASEGVHRPIGRYIFNNVNFPKDDPLVEKLRAANYRVFNNPYNNDGVIVTLPVEFPECKFDHDENGKPVNRESAVEQLERYKLLMDTYVDHNCSITVSYDPEEVPEIVDWIYNNWDNYVGVSFILRADPSKTAADLGFPYLPQEVVDGSTYRQYVDQLLEVDIDGGDIVEDFDDCSTGACPIR
jgi:ribonucleoside-triphosphate reductase